MLRAWDGSVEQIERDILLREIEAHLTAEEAWIFHLKSLGFSSEEIAKPRGSSVNSVDKVMSRMKQKFRALAGVKGVENTGRAQVVPRHPSIFSSLADEHRHRDSR